MESSRRPGRSAAPGHFGVRCLLRAPVHSPDGCHSAGAAVRARARWCLAEPSGRCGAILRRPLHGPAARARRKAARHLGCKGAASVLICSSWVSDKASIRFLQGTPGGVMHFIHGNSLAARKCTLAGDRDGIADMRDVEHDREYGSFREFLSAVAVAPEGLICVLLKLGFSRSPRRLKSLRRRPPNACVGRGKP
jgi:hypothetical protein